jgi:PAS domain S-box-containing protein
MNHVRPAPGGATLSMVPSEPAAAGTADSTQANELARARSEVAALRSELDATNHGLLALYSELDRANLAEARLAAIVRSSDDVMCTTDPAGAITTWNSGGERLLGFTAAETIGRPLVWLFDVEQAPGVDTLVSAARTSRRSAGADMVVRRADGSKVEVALTVSAVGPGGPGDALCRALPASRASAGHVSFPVGEGPFAGFAATMRDLTYQRRAEDEVRARDNELLLLEERERVARDLHDTVIQRLFATGLSLAVLQARLPAGPNAARVAEAVEMVDGVIREIRETIFALDLRSSGTVDLREHLAPVLDELTGPLGFRPRLAVRGCLPSTGAPVAHDVVCVVREALTNVAKHARASRADVVVDTGNGVLAVTVADDGDGIPDGPGAGNGLANMTERARRHGGDAAVERRSPRGTLVTWRVPLGEEH